MSPFEIQINDGCLKSDIEVDEVFMFDELQKIGALEEIDSLWRLKSIYRSGRLYLSKPPNTKAFIESQTKEQRDLLIEESDIGSAKNGDVVIARRIIAKRGRASAKIVMVIKRAYDFSIVYTVIDEDKKLSIIDIKTALPTDAYMEGMDISILKNGTVLKVDNEDGKVIEILGILSEPKTDEKISLALYDRKDKFDEDCVSQAKAIDNFVDKSKYPNRIDLTDLNFCTIDPVTAKDFDDAIFFDKQNYILYVAIADVSEYVEYFSPIDIEAKRRAFTTYLPHKSFPMLPRELSENLCSLKPKVDRFAFVAKIYLDRSSLKPMKEEFFEAIIHSKRRFNYDEIDSYLAGKEQTGVDKEMLKSLMPLYEITKKLKTQRVKDGFDFRTKDIRISIDNDHLLKSTSIESSTPSHSLIEECMLLANQASAKRFEKGIFRVHEAPQLIKLEKLLEDLAVIGLFINEYEDSKSLIRAIQKEAKKLDMSSEVDGMIIKSLKQASYTDENVGHFGLGFTHYSHFTSPIRRYSDLILHRLIKAQLNDDEKEKDYLMRNIKSLCARVSDIERQSTKAEWDFRDRKFARWAKQNEGLMFNGEIVELKDSSAKVLLDEDIQGVVVNIRNEDISLFDKVRVIIETADIASTDIMANLVVKIKE